MEAAPATDFTNNVPSFPLGDEGKDQNQTKEEVKSHDPNITAERGTEDWGNQVMDKFKKENEAGVEVQELALPSYEHVSSKISGLEK